MMKILNGIIYLALMFYLGTGAVVNTEPKISEDTPADVRALFEEMIEKPMVNQMVEHTVADIDPQNEQLITDDPKTADLQNVEGMRCRGRGRTAMCCVGIRRLPRICIAIQVSSAGIRISLYIHHHRLISKTFRGNFHRTFWIRYGPVSIGLNVALQHITPHYFKVCFKLAYKAMFFHGHRNLGCISRRFLSNENSAANRIKDLDSQVKDSLELQDFDTGKIYSVGNLGEENQNEDSLIWQRDE